jgi:hypothetical protein
VPWISPEDICLPSTARQPAIRPGAVRG